MIAAADRRTAGCRNGGVWVDSGSPADTVRQIYGARVSGACVVSSVSGDGRTAHLHVGGRVTVAAYAPPRVAVVVPKALGGRQIQEGGAFAVSLVAEDQADWLATIATQPGRGVAGLGPEHFLRATSGCPVLAGGVGYLDCRLQAAEDLGGALLAVGDLKAAALIHPDKANLTVAAGPDRAAHAPIPAFAAGPYDAGVLAPAPTGGPPNRDLLGRIYERRRLGLFLSSAHDRERIAMHLSAWVLQCPEDPERLLCCFDRSADDAAIVRSGGVFALTLLAADQLPLILDLFAVGAGSRDADPLRDVRLRTAQTGCPVLDEGVAFFDCEVERHVEAGTDSLLAVGRVVDFGWLRPYKHNLRDDELRAAL